MAANVRAEQAVPVEILLEPDATTVRTTAQIPGWAAGCVRAIVSALSRCRRTSFNLELHTD